MLSLNENLMSYIRYHFPTLGDLLTPFPVIPNGKTGRIMSSDFGYRCPFCLNYYLTFIKILQNLEEFKTYPNP